MKNYHYPLKDYTVLPDGKRVVYLQQQATNLFAKQGFKGKVKLCYLIDRQNTPRLFWLCLKGNTAIANLPVFKEEKSLEGGGCAAVQFCAGNELICHDDVFYITYFNAKKQLCLAMVQCFLNEELVRQACALRNRRVVSVRLVRLYDTETCKYVAVCWQVNYFKDVLDDGFFFVDLRDGIVLEYYDFSNTETYEVGIGDSFLAYDTYYALRKDKDGTLYVAKNPVQLTLGGKYGVDN